MANFIAPRLPATSLACDRQKKQDDDVKLKDDVADEADDVQLHGSRCLDARHSFEKELTESEKEEFEIDMRAALDAMELWERRHTDPYRFFHETVEKETQEFMHAAEIVLRNLPQLVVKALEDVGGKFDIPGVIRVKRTTAKKTKKTMTTKTRSKTNKVSQTVICFKKLKDLCGGGGLD